MRGGKEVQAEDTILYCARARNSRTLQDIMGYNRKRLAHCPSPLSPYLGTPMDKAIEGEGKG